MESFDRPRLERFTWQFADTRSVLASPTGLRALSDSLAGASLVKQGAHRSVYRLTTFGQGFYLKHYRAPSWHWRLRNVFRASAAKREFLRAAAILARGVSTAEVVAFAEAYSSGIVTESLLLTREIASSRTLETLLADELPQYSPAAALVARRRLARLLGEYLARMHAAGIDHDDLHTGNLLIQGDLTGDTPALYLIDVPKVRLSGPLSLAGARRSLAMLASSLTPWIRGHDAARFARAYFATRPLQNKIDRRRFGEEVLRAAAVHTRGVCRGRDQRALRNNRHFQRFTSENAAGHRVSDFSSENLAKLADDPMFPIRRDRDAVEKIGHASVVVKSTLALAEGPIGVAYKRYRTRAGIRRWLASAGARALRAWVVGHGLRMRGIATPRPLVVIVPREGCDSYLATEWIAGVNLHLYLWELAKRPTGERTKKVRLAAEALGKLIGKLHDFHIAHRDLKGTNLMCTEVDEEVRASLIDLDGVAIRRWLTDQQRVENLARLAVSLARHPWVTRTDRRRFLRAYLKAQPLRSLTANRLWREVERASRARLTRFSRQGERPA